MPQCEELFLECHWIGKIFDCCELFQLQRSEEGFCYSFNSLTSVNNQHWWDVFFSFFLFLRKRSHTPPIDRWPRNFPLRDIRVIFPLISRLWLNFIQMNLHYLQKYFHFHVLQLHFWHSSKLFIAPLGDGTSRQIKRIRGGGQREGRENNYFCSFSCFLHLSAVFWLWPYEHPRLGPTIFKALSCRSSFSIKAFGGFNFKSAPFRDDCVYVENLIAFESSTLGKFTLASWNCLAVEINGFKVVDVDGDVREGRGDAQENNVIKMM